MRAYMEDSAAILVDIQERLVPAMYRGEETVKSCVSLIQGLQILNIPILAARQYPKGLGDLVEPVRDVLGVYKSYDKMSFSVYGDPKMKEKLREMGKKNIFVFGIETHICVLQSVIDLQNDGYQVYLVSDCATSRKETDHKMAIKRAQAEGALVTTREAALYELLREAGSDQFKQISKLVKEM